MLDSLNEVARDPSVITTLAGHVADVLDLFDLGQIGLGTFIGTVCAVIVTRVLNRGKTRNTRSKQ